MKAIGTAVLKKELKTKIWPSCNSHSIINNYDLETAYKNGLSGKAVTVLEISNDKEDYLVLGNSEKCGDFIWNVDSVDVLGFLPIIKQNGQMVIVKEGLSATIASSLKASFDSPEWKKLVDLYKEKMK